MAPRLIKRVYIFFANTLFFEALLRGVCVGGGEGGLGIPYPIIFLPKYSVSRFFLWFAFSTLIFHIPKSLVEISRIPLIFPKYWPSCPHNFFTQISHISETPNRS